MTSVRELARQERAEFAELLAGLTPQQWSTPSLCAGWSVRDVAAHTLAYLDQSRLRLAVEVARTRFDLDRLNSTGLTRYAGVPPERLVDLIARRADPSGAAALYGSRVALTECLIHQQDVRRPLGRPRIIPEDRLRAALTFARISPVIRGARRTRGVRLAADDVDWSAGRGPIVRGQAEALLLAMTGRIACVADELSGDGVTLLR